MANDKISPQALAFPLSFEEEYGDFGGKRLTEHLGFTKRQVIAKDILCALISSPNTVVRTIDDHVAQAIELTDLFINQYNK